MTQSDQATAFRNAHRPGRPLVLYNIWDAGGAAAVQAAGAQAIATGSWSVAAAQGYADGQSIPFDTLVQITTRIVAAVDIPVSVDIEAGFAETPKDIAQNVARLIGAGAVGVNFEDQVIGGRGLRDVSGQTARIAAIRTVAEDARVPMFINARTDVFLQADPADHAQWVDDAIQRAKAYGAAGADGVFVPGLTDPGLIGRICGAVDLPVNVMHLGQGAASGALAQAGVARISYGPQPYLDLMAQLTCAAQKALGSRK